MRHWAGLKWLRGWDIRMKPSAVGSCTGKMALALQTRLACLCLPALLCLECRTFLCPFWRRGTRREMVLLPSAVCQSNLHEKRISLCWWTFTNSNNSLWQWIVVFIFFATVHFHAWQFIRPFSIKLVLGWEGIMPVEWAFTLWICVLPSLCCRKKQRWQTVAVISKTLSKSSFKLVFPF